MHWRAYTVTWRNDRLGVDGSVLGMLLGDVTDAIYDLDDSRDWMHAGLLSVQPWRIGRLTGSRNWSGLEVGLTYGL